METIIEFEGKQFLEDKEKSDISEIVFDSFEQKFIAVSPKMSREKWAGILKEILTYNLGLYYKKDNKIQGVALLTLKKASTFSSFPKIIKHLGLLKGILFCLFFVNPVKSVKEIKLDLIAVQSLSRGSGIGGHLLNYLIEFAKKKEYESIILEVVDTNPKAKNLYLRLGFKTIKSINTQLFTTKAGFKAYDIMKLDLRK